MISKSALYALRATVELAQLPAETYATAAHIAEACEAPAKYLSKLLEILIDNGMVRSRKGFHGGYALTRAAAEITVFEVVEPIDHVSRMPECLLGKRQCSGVPPCAAHDRWRQVRESLFQMLTHTSLAELSPALPQPAASRS